MFNESRKDVVRFLKIVGLNEYEIITRSNKVIPVRVPEQFRIDFIKALGFKVPREQEADFAFMLDNFHDAVLDIDEDKY